MGDNSTSSEPQCATSARYNQLLLVLDKSLSQSRKNFNTEEAIQECYGDDASMFEDAFSDNSNFLASAIDAMVDQVNDKVRREMMNFLEEEKIEERLGAIEAIINNLDRRDEQDKQADAEDRQSARDALEAAKLPKDVLPADVIRHQAYRVMEKERDTLRDEISKVESDINELDGKITQSESQANRGIQSLQAVGQDLRKAAATLAEPHGKDLAGQKS